jgi:histone deacetylase 6
MELSDASHMFFLGIGQAYSGLVEMLKANDRCRDRLTKIIGFISDDCGLPSYKSTTDDFLDHWYRDASHIFVAKEHYVWEKSKTKALSKRWGTLEHSEYNNMQDMLAHHHKEVTGILTILTEGWKMEAAPAVGAKEGDM